MSGGHFDYKQYEITTIADTIESILEKQGQRKTRDEIYSSEEYLEKYPEERFHYTYPTEIHEKFKEAIKFLRISGVYAQRVDWLLSGDDGEETFLKRLKEDLDKLNSE